MAMYGCVCLDMAMYCYVGLCRSMYGYVGLYRTMYGCVGLCRAMYGYVGLSMVMYGYAGLIDKHFPKSNPLHKILNRNTLKLSYSCMNNVKAIISNHNKAVISRSSNLPVQTINTCNCPDKRSCPMDGNCNERNIIY